MPQSKDSECFKRKSTVGVKRAHGKNYRGKERKSMARKYGAWANPPEPVGDGDIAKHIDTEVLVIGAGIAGVSCALRAAQTGAKVTVLEKNASWSGRGGNIGVANSSFMKAQGYENDIDELSREWIKRCSNRCDERIVRRYMREGARAMDWLVNIVTNEEYGARAALQGSIYKGETYRERYGSHRFFGGPMEKKGMRSGAPDAVNAMYSEAVKLGVSFIFKTSAKYLIKDERRRVIGAVAEGEDGFIEVKASRGVVLATGDIGGNEDMCEDLCPSANDCAKKLYWPKGGNMGDGHRMGLWAGGTFEDAPFPMILHPQSFHFRNYCFLFVKPDGKRFMNEDSYVQGKTVAILREREKFVWSIMDGNWREQVPASLPYGGGLFWGDDCEAGQSEFVLENEEKMLSFGLERGYIVTADTPEELAKRMDVPIKTFTDTLERYNELVKKGKDEDFGKRRELLMPLDTPPYYAMKFGPALLAVVGGLKVDEEMRVLYENGGAIEGLYAVGNTAGGRYGVDYPILIPGNSHGTALTFGFLLGEALGLMKS